MAEKQIMGVWYRPMCKPVRIRFKNELKISSDWLVDILKLLRFRLEMNIKGHW